MGFTCEVLFYSSKNFLMGFFNRTVIMTVTFIFFASDGFSQEKHGMQAESFMQLYAEVNREYGIDQQLFNGVYFEDLDRDAVGHPYLAGDTFALASLHYRDKWYESVPLKYDIYRQQVVVKNEGDDRTLVTLLNPAFLEFFHVHDMDFRKVTGDDGIPRFFQVVAEERDLQCYYRWTRDRNEKIMDDDSKRYFFMAARQKKYLVLEGQQERYLGNWSFLRILPRSVRGEIRKFLRGNDIRVNRASETEIKLLIAFCQETLDRKKPEAGLRDPGMTGRVKSGSNSWSGEPVESKKQQEDLSAR